MLVCGLLAVLLSVLGATAEPLPLLDEVFPDVLPIPDEVVLPAVVLLPEPDAAPCWCGVVAV